MYYFIFSTEVDYGDNCDIDCLILFMSIRADAITQLAFSNIEFATEVGFRSRYLQSK